MPTNIARSSKSKVTVTLSPDLIRKLDDILNASASGSRSRLVEEALRWWLREQTVKELERQTEEYYHSLSKAERKEDHEWSKIAARSAKRLWDK